jgi:nucleotide-binding universal stress UspA family protein
MPRVPPPLVIAYDGSPGARQAVLEAGRLFPGATAHVATAWEPPGQWSSAWPVGAWLNALEPPPPELDVIAERWAHETSQEGTQAARGAGLDAAPATPQGPPVPALLALAEQVDAGVVVIGARAHHVARDLLLGSISRRLVHDSPRPVLVVHPPPED